MNTNAEIDPAAAMIESGWRARWVDGRYDLAHEMFSNALIVSLARNDSRAAANALLAVANNLVWHCPTAIEESAISQEQVYEAALGLYHASGDDRGAAAALRGLGRFEESLAISRKHTDLAGMASTLERMAVSEASRGNLEKARSLIDEALALVRRTDDHALLAYILQSGAICVQDDVDARSAMLQEALQLYERLGHSEMLGRARSLLLALMTADAKHDEIVSSGNDDNPAENRSKRNSA